MVLAWRLRMWPFIYENVKKIELKRLTMMENQILFWDMYS